MVKVCDMPTGFGKSSACINYINSHPEYRYVYITPYIDETERIIAACPDAKFYKPNRASVETHHSKTLDTLPQLLNKRNIATTHQAFLFYTPEIVDAIQAGDYVLMIDESVNILEELNTDLGDLDVMIDAGFIVDENGHFRTGRDDYRGSHFRDIMRKLRSREMYMIRDDGENSSYMYWVMPVDILRAFREVIVMTYQFASQDMFYYFKMNEIQFKYIGVVKDESGYHFNETLLDVPHPAIGVEVYRDLLHICDDPRRNRVGNNRNALSMNWFDKNNDGMIQLRGQLTQWFRYDMRQYGEEYRLCGTYSKEAWWKKLKAKGYTNSNLSFNYRATNNYADRRVLAYACNLFLPGSKTTFFKNCGIDISEDQYALSTMIQWIWRSAIRKGEEVWIYIPSRRMRELLQGWLNGLGSDGCHTDLAAEGRCDDGEGGMQQMFVERGMQVQEAV